MSVSKRKYYNLKNLTYLKSSIKPHGLPFNIHRQIAFHHSIHVEGSPYHQKGQRETQRSRDFLFRLTFRQASIIEISLLRVSQRRNGTDPQIRSDKNTAEGK